MLYERATSVSSLLVCVLVCVCLDSVENSRALASFPLIAGSASLLLCSLFSLSFSVCVYTRAISFLSLLASHITVYIVADGV